MRIIICLLALVALVACPGCKKPVSKAEQLYEKAVEQKELQRYDEAQRLFRRAVDADPAFDKPYFELGEMNEVVLGNYTEAVTWYEKFLGVTKNEKMKDQVAGIVKDLRNELRNAPAPGAEGTPATLAGPAKETLVKAVADEKAKLERDFSIRQKSFAAQKDREFEQLKDEIRKLKSDNVDFENKVQELRIERDAATKKAEANRGHEEIAKLLSSSTFTGSDKEKELAQKLLDLQAKLEKANAEAGTERGKTKQVETQLVRLQQQVAESGKPAASSADADKRVTDLQDENKRLAEQVALLKRSVEDASSAVITRADPAARETIDKLKTDLADAMKETEKLQAEKQRAVEEARDMKKKADDLAAAATSTSTAGASTFEENRNLRTQIDTLRDKYNDLSDKLTSSEQHAQTLKDDLDKLQALQPVAKDAAESGFSDLSDEIKKMQNTIDAQKRLIVKRDTEIGSLTEQNQKLQRQTDGKQPTDSSKQLVGELNQRIEQLSRELEQAKATAATPAPSLESVDIVPEAVAAATRTEPVNLPGAAPTTAPTPAAPASRPAPAALPGSTPTPRTPPAASAAPRPSGTGGMQRGTRVYRVQSGDTLGRIAEKVYGDKSKWMVIFNNNRQQLPTASALRVGMGLYIPPAQP